MFMAIMILKYSVVGFVGGGMANGDPAFGDHSFDGLPTLRKDLALVSIKC